MIQEIGCTDKGGIWISLMIEVNGEQQRGILPMNKETGEKLHKAIGKALKQGKQWANTGMRPATAPIPAKELVEDLKHG